MAWSKQFSKQTPSRTGFSLIESVVTIGLTSILILLFGATYNVASTNKFINHRSLAYQFAAEELEIIRHTNFDELATRTNAAFIGVAETHGSWNVQSDVTAPSSAQIIHTTPGTGTPTSKIFIPNFAYTNFNFAGSFIVDTASADNWIVYYFFRYEDTNNYYAVKLTNAQAVLQKKVNGITTELTSVSKVFTKNTWYAIALNALDNAFTVTLNGTALLSGSDAQNDIVQGRLGLAADNGASTGFDSLVITTGGSTTYNFDTYQSGALPSVWVRYGITQLPQGNAYLTISHPEPSSQNLKMITARVTWIEKGIAKQVELSTLITK